LEQRVKDSETAEAVMQHMVQRGDILIDSQGQVTVKEDAGATNQGPSHSSSNPQNEMMTGSSLNIE
jgi:hypothetical protein